MSRKLPIATPLQAAERVPLVAFYLPQFHRIPENDRWWGEGFTEWRTVASARPWFAGHEQPHRPAELGCYDLLDPEMRMAQAALARAHGIDAFCYYHYWFEGRRLLERPFEAVLESGQPDLPFCLCWANESWTRRYDGRTRETLLEQRYSAADDREHGRWLGRVLRDPRYLRLDGRPVVLVYRARSLPDPGRTAATWREEAYRQGAGNPLLCAVESNFRAERGGPPESIGFDAAVEFQPDQYAAPLASSLRLSAAGAIASARCALRTSLLRGYASLAAAALARPPARYRRFPCVTPGWDNSARRAKGGALLYTGSSPQLYERWLETQYRRELARDEAGMVFVNAWNEWGEGCHLEPDQRHGRAYLDATLRAKRAARARLEEAATS